MSSNQRASYFCSTILFAGVLVVPGVPAIAQSLSYMPVSSYEPAIPQYAPQDSQQGDVATDELPPQLRRQIVSYSSTERPGTVIIDTGHTFLYLTLGNGKALRYGIGVGRQGFTWSGVQTISRKAEWPDWIPPADMVARQPYLPRWVGGGPGNPSGRPRALSRQYRLSHPRHQRSDHDWQACVERVHPPAKCRRDRSVRARRTRHQGRGAAQRSRARRRRRRPACRDR